VVLEVILVRWATQKITELNRTDTTCAPSNSQ